MRKKGTKRPLRYGTSRNVEGGPLASQSVNNDNIAVGEEVGQSCDAGTADDKNELTNTHFFGLENSATGTVCGNLAKK